MWWHLWGLFIFGDFGIYDNGCYLGVSNCCQYLELYLRSKTFGNLVNKNIRELGEREIFQMKTKNMSKMIHLKTSPFKAQGWTVVVKNFAFLNFEETGSFGQLELHFIRSHLPHEVFENQCFSLFSCQSWIGTFGIRDWIRPTMEDSFNLSLLSRFKTVLCRKTNSWSWWLKVASEITRTWMKSAWRNNLLVWSDVLPEWKQSLSTWSDVLPEWRYCFVWSDFPPEWKQYFSMIRIFTCVEIFFSPAKKIQQRKVQEERKPNILTKWKYCIAVLMVIRSAKSLVYLKHGNLPF